MRRVLLESDFQPEKSTCRHSIVTGAENGDVVVQDRNRRCFAPRADETLLQHGNDVAVRFQQRLELFDVRQDARFCWLGERACLVLVVRKAYHSLATLSTDGIEIRLNRVKEI